MGIPINTETERTVPTEELPEQMRWPFYSNFPSRIRYYIRHVQKRRSFSIIFLSLVLLTFVFNLWQYLPFDNIQGEPRHNILFLKTHKCASSTIQNILMRYGDTNNLTFVLPSSANYFGHPEPFSRRFVPNLPVKNFNIFTHHTRYSFQEMTFLMPEDTAFVTVVRDPSELFKSLYSYFLLEEYFQMDLETLLKNYSAIVDVMGNKRYYRRVGLNQMAFDLGMDTEDFYDADIATKFCKSLDQQFDLVMVAERMEESLILLMDLMHWTIDDVVVFPQNVRKSNVHQSLSKVGMERLRRVNQADEIIYNFFVKSFDLKVKEYGRRKMALMVKMLQKRTQALFKSCVKRTIDQEEVKEPTKRKGVVSKTSEFEIRYLKRYEAKAGNEICKSMLQSELEYTKILREKQNKRLYQNTKLKPYY